MAATPSVTQQLQLAAQRALQVRAALQQAAQQHYGQPPPASAPAPTPGRKP